jgi:bifunctional UDP-N-acetylglucosamine pyrophosphorylase/glucosamine-1-phosphate N-acetyltransferase
MYVFGWQALKKVLPELDTANAKGEYFLTDAIALLAQAGERISAYITPDASEVLGVNSREHLAEAEALMRQRINRRWMAEGVTMEDPSTTFIGGEVTIGRDTILRPLVMLEGATTVGEGCILGPNTRVVDSRLGNGVTVEQATLRECELEDGVNVGPYASLRPGSVFRAGSKAGTFVETKKTVVGKRSKVPHLSYMGDADIGDDVNIGAGSITCNYDGARKHRTVIEDEAFIGSDTMFIAPVRIGKGAVTGAGSSISKDVPPGGLGVERSEQRNIIKYKRKTKKKEEGRP